LTDRNAFGVAADFVERAGRSAGSTVVPVALQIDARTTAGLACATCDAARPAVLAIALQIDAITSAAGLDRSAGDLTGAAVVLVGVEVEALAVALIATSLAFAFAVLAFGTTATVIVLGAVLADLLAGSRQAGAEQQG
jgi:hypothetical protein